MENQQQQGIENLKPIFRNAKKIQWVFLGPINHQNILSLSIKQMTITQIQLIQKYCPLLKKIKIQKWVSREITQKVLTIPLLQYLSINTSCISAFVQNCHKMKNIKKLRLGNFYLDEKHLEILSDSIPDIQKLIIQGSRKLTCNAINPLNRLRNLSMLGFRYIVKVIEDDFVSTIVGTLSNLRQLQFIDCTFQSQKSLICLKDLTKLNSLSVKYSKTKKGKDLRITGASSQMVRVRLNYSEITIQEIRQYTERYPLVDIIQFENSNIDDDGLQVLSKKTKSIKKLDISWSSRVCQGGILKICQAHRNILILNLNGCIQIDDQCIQKISLILTKLKKLSLCCCKIQWKGITYIRKLIFLEKLELSFRRMYLPSLSHLFRVLTSLNFFRLNASFRGQVLKNKSFIQNKIQVNRAWMDIL